MNARQFDFFIAVGLVVFCSATVWADAVPDPTDGAIATDEALVPPSPKEVAEEIARIQQEMGGSITAGFGSPPPWTPSMPMSRPEPYVPAIQSPVHALRETAWQLDQAAHRLESLDLYDQADSLRDTAAKLRQDAREMKAALASKESQ